MSTASATTTAIARTPKGAIRVDCNTRPPEILMALHADKVISQDKELPADLTPHDVYVTVDVSLEDGKSSGLLSLPTRNTSQQQQQQPSKNPGYDVLCVLVKAAVRGRLQDYYTAPNPDSARMVLQVYLTTVSRSNAVPVLQSSGNCKCAVEWFLSRPQTVDGPAEIVKAGRTAKDSTAVLNRDKVLTEKVAPALVNQLIEDIGVGV